MLKRLFEAADTSDMDTKMKDDYKSSILSEADYEYLMDGARKEGLEMGLQQGREQGLDVPMIEKLTGLCWSDIEGLGS